MKYIFVYISFIWYFSLYGTSDSYSPFPQGYLNDKYALKPTSLDWG